MQEWRAKKYTDKEGYKSEGKYTKPCSYIFTLLCKDVGIDEALYIDLHFCILPCLCTFWHAIPTSLCIFNDFSVWLIDYKCFILLYSCNLVLQTIPATQQCDFIINVFFSTTTHTRFQCYSWIEYRWNGDFWFRCWCTICYIGHTSQLVLHLCMYRL